jgi:Flp pilus assembly protein TadG
MSFSAAATRRSRHEARARRARRSEEGVELVEFAIVATLLFLLVFGIIDFGWAFSQNLDVKHATRETARLAAVNADTSTAALVADAQNQSSDLTGSKMTIRLGDCGANGATPGAVGTVPALAETIKVQVQYPLKSLSGLTSALNGGQMSSTVDIRMEQNATWATNWQPATCP